MDETRTSQHHDLIHQAMRIARHALPQDVPVGAVLLYEGQIIAEASNRREVDQNPLGHAELLVIQQAGTVLKRWRLTDTTLYVTLEPCPMCASAIQQARIGRVVFGAYDPVMGACGSKYGLLLNTPETEVIGGIEEAACRALLTDFFRELR